MDAEKLLAGYSGESGAFLVRESASYAGYCLSFVYVILIQHSSTYILVHINLLMRVKYICTLSSATLLHAAFKYIYFTVHARAVGNLCP